MRDYSFHLEKQNNHQKIKTNISKIIVLFIVFFAITSAILIGKFTSQKPQTTASEIDNQPTPSTAKQNISKSENLTPSSELISSIERIMNEDVGTYSIYIYDIKKEKGYGIDENIVLTAASVNKISILAVLYHLAGKEEIDLDKTVVPQPSDIQDYGSGTIRYDPPGRSYSLKTLARLMMEKSDNTAAYILASLIIGTDKIQSYIDNWGLMQTNIAKNKTSAKDMSLLLIKMYKGEITTPALTSEMLDFMDKSDYDDRIPAGIGDETKVYHKTGDEIGAIHDAGIIDLKNRPYYLGIFTIDASDDQTTKKSLSEISRLVYEFMKKS